MTSSDGSNFAFGDPNIEFAHKRPVTEYEKAQRAQDIHDRARQLLGGATVVTQEAKDRAEKEYGSE